jgi:thioredoxin 1
MAMSNHCIKTEHFKSIIQQYEIVIIIFWTTGCTQYQQFKIIYEQIATLYSDIMFTNVNVEIESELAEMLNIHSIPQLLIFKQGIVIYSQAGSISALTLQESVIQAKSVDVHAIRHNMDAGNL